VLRAALPIVLGSALLALNSAKAADAASEPPANASESRPKPTTSSTAPEPQPAPTPPAADQPAAAPDSQAPAEEPSLDQLYEAGKTLFDTYAPPEVKEQYEFPSREQFDQFTGRLQHALDNDNLAELARYLPEARTALTALRTMPGYEAYADWLQERIDYIEAAREISTPPAPKPVTPTPPTERPAPPSPAAARVDVPYYELWMARMRARPAPDRATDLMPALQAAFVAEGVPAEIAWLAEAESSLNPEARSPAGAKGLFQLMPATAKSLGLSTFLPDERTNAAKSARAAAKYLRQLHDKFGDWPLAFAAYNAGEGRVDRLLKQKKASSFADIAGALRSETRMYVPKVCATIAVRAGVPVTALEPAAG
jgi:membrane-bound lytic murein transglycosylase D